MKQLELEVATPRRRVVIYNDPPGSDGVSAEVPELYRPVDASQGMKFGDKFILYSDWELHAAPTMSGWYQVMVTSFTMSMLWWDVKTDCFYQSDDPSAAIIVPPSITRPWRGLQEQAPGFYPDVKWEPTLRPSNRRVILEN